jgi:hypothetical protein
MQRDMKKRKPSHRKHHRIATNIRLSPEELLEYRLMALEAGKSFSAFVRDSLKDYSRLHAQKMRKARSV